MKLTSLILEQLDREAELTRRAPEQVPDGKNDWKPHPKLVQALDKAVWDAREAVSETTDKALQTPWKLLEGGKVVNRRCFGLILRR